MNDNETKILEKREDETPLQHHRRIVLGKLVDKTLADYDFSELSQYAYGKKFAPDVARRMMYGSRYTLELQREDDIDKAECGCPDVETDINAQILELQKERQRLFDQRREYKKNVVSDARLDNLCDALEKAAASLPQTVGRLFDNEEFTAHIRDRGFGFDDDGPEAVLVLSDWHYGLKTNNIFNSYNTDICRSRVRNIVRKARQRVIDHGCSKLHVVVLGDLFHGAIHVSARVASEELVCDQLMQASELLAQAIIELASAVESTNVYMTYGNHARTVQNKKENIHRDNMERLVPWWLEQRFIAEERNSGVNMNIKIIPDNGTEFLLVDSCGYQICAVHGDLDSVKQSPRLISSLLAKTLNRDVDYILLGDKHHGESYEELGITAMMCGSLCGADDYANDNRLYSMPSQLLLIVNEHEGVDAEYRLKCN